MPKNDLDNSKRVLVLNQFALPLSQPGGTRHAELFDQLQGWSTLIISGNRNFYTQKRYEERTTNYQTVRVTAYGSSRCGRIASWLSFCGSAFLPSVTARHLSVVYASSPHLLTPLLGWVVARARRVPLIVEIRDLWPQVLVEMGELRAGSPLHRFLSLLERFLYRRASAIVAVTHGWETHMRGLGVPPNKVTVIANGADIELLRPTITKEAARDQLDIHGKVAVFAGAHGPMNGLDSVLDAARVCRDVTFLLIGDGTEKSRLRQRAAAEGLANVVFHEPVPKASLGNVLVAADVGLHTVVDISLLKLGMSPNKLYDYMAAGLPVITTAGGSVGAVVEAEGLGMSVEPSALAMGLTEFFRMQTRTDEPSPQRYVDTHVSRRVVSRQLITLLNSVVCGETKHEQVARS